METESFFAPFFEEITSHLYLRVPKLYSNPFLSSNKVLVQSSFQKQIHNIFTELSSEPPKTMQHVVLPVLSVLSVFLVFFLPNLAVFIQHDHKSLSNNRI